MIHDLLERDCVALINSERVEGALHLVIVDRYVPGETIYVLAFICLDGIGNRRLG